MDTPVPDVRCAAARGLEELVIKGLRGALLSSFALTIPATANAEEAQGAMELIREEGVLKSTGKPVPPALVGAIVLGGAAAAASFKFGGAGDTPVPTGISADADEASYEASKWTNEVELPWKQSSEPQLEAEANADDGSASGPA